MYETKAQKSERLKKEAASEINDRYRNHKLWQKDVKKKKR